MSKETKLGLLISLGVILAFAMIISIHLGRDGHAALEDNKGESTLGNYGQIARTGGDDSQDAIDQALDEAGTAADRQAASDPIDPAAIKTTDNGLTLPDEGANGSRVVVVFKAEDDSTGPGSLGTRTDGQTGQPREPIVMPPLPPVQPAAQTYTVKSGDRLATIAEKYYGPGKSSKWTLIKDANPGINPNVLKIGTVLKIPALPGAPVTQVAGMDRPSLGDPVGKAGSASAVGQHVVAKGDTLSEISTKYYGTVRKMQLIVAANPGLNPNSLRVGTKLTIPAAPRAMTPPTMDPTIITTPPMPGTPTAPARPVFDELNSTRVATDEQALSEVRRFVDTHATRASTATYTVSPGDTLSSISKKQFGSSARWKEIYELNRDKLSSPTSLKINQVLRLPATDTAMSDSPVLY